VVSQALRLGLTGGIGSGKSTVATLMAQHGAFVIDADAISRATTGPSGSAIDQLIAVFGPDILSPQGGMNREKMRHLAFNDFGIKSKLEAIVHPLVSEEISRQAQLADRTGAPCIVFDIPLLVESKHWRKTLDRVLVIDCSAATQISRVTARNGLSEPEVSKILNAQTSREVRLGAADLVVFNEGMTLELLAQHVQEIGTQFGL
jgi:dephospho-CoA kinase